MIQALFDSKLLLYFLLILGIIAISIWTLFFIEIIKANDKILETLFLVNNTQLFVQQETHEDDARDQQRYLIVRDTNKSINTSISKLEDNLTDFMKQSENRFMTESNERDDLINDIKEILQNQDVVISILTNLSRDIKMDTNDTNVQISKYGPENNAMAKRILEEIGVNATELLQKEVYSNNTLKEMIQ